MKNSWLVLLASLAAFTLMLGPVGCGDDDDNGGPTPGNPGGPGGGGGGQGSDANRAFEAYCNHLVDCAQAGGVQIDRDLVCQGYQSALFAASYLGRQCADATAGYFDCLSKQPCNEDDGSCDVYEDRVDRACATDE